MRRKMGITTLAVLMLLLGFTVGWLSRGQASSVVENHGEVVPTDVEKLKQNIRGELDGMRERAEKSKTEERLWQLEQDSLYQKYQEQRQQSER